MENENIVSQDIVNAPETPIEKMVPQSRVNELIGSAKASAAEKARREASEQYEQQIAQLKSTPTQNMGGMTQPNQEEIYNQIKDRFAKEAYEKQMDELAGRFLQKYSSGNTLYDDFDAVTADLDPRAFPQLVILTADMDNTADIMYELAKNPGKLMTINGLAQHSPKMAQKQLQVLSDSIRANRQALQENPGTNAPLPKLKPSTAAGADTGVTGIRDYKNADWLRG